ncbi:MFS transporter (plasmid) [Deinococcus radiomollis]|uniref:MFS transporter n=1 Tax=Deinococcus radiomollis TaxID=468916 RepID=UPI0038924054
MSVLTFWLSWTRMTETRTGAPATRSEMGLPALLRSYAAVVSDRRFLLFTLGGIAVLSIEFSRSNWIAVHLAEHFHSQLVLGALINGVRASSVLVGLNTLLIVALTAPVTRWIQARVPRPMMNLGFALFALGFSVLAFSTNLPALLIASVVLSMGEMLYVPTRQALLADLIPGERRGAYLAVNGQVFTLAKWVAALGLPIGAVLGAPGMAAIVLGLGVLGILLTSLALLQVPGRRVSPSA